MNSTLLEILREVRAAVLAGVAWMLTIWIALRAGIDPAVSDSATATAIARLSVILGNIGGLLALLIVAVGLGTISQQVFRAPSIWIANFSTYLVRGVEAIIVKLLALPKKAPKLKRYSAWEPVAVDLARRILRRHQDEVMAAMPSGMESEYEHMVYAEVDRLIFQELQPSDEDGRLRSLDDQAGTRLATVIPVAAFVVTASLQLSPYFAVFAPAPFIIAFQAGAIRNLRDLTLQRDVWQQIDLAAMATSLRDQQPESLDS